MSLALIKNFRDAPGTSSSPLEVEIVDDHTTSDSRVFRGCILNMFSYRFPIYLVMIPLRGSKVIIVMDWLGPNGPMIDYEWQLVRVRTPSVEHWLLLVRELHMDYLSI